MFHGDAKDLKNDLISRDIILPQPLFTLCIEVKLVEAANVVNAKFDIIGHSSAKRYAADPIMEPITKRQGLLQ